MTLTKEDKDWFADALKKTKHDLQQSFHNATSELGKRVYRLEHAFNLVSRAARSQAVEKAKNEHASLLRCMFDKADLLLIPPFEGGARKMVIRDTAAVQSLVAEYDDKYEVELNKTMGYRLVHTSRSAQVCRKAGASMIKHMKKEAMEKLGLVLQYDKPWELRLRQTAAHKFLSGLKSIGGTLVSDVTVKAGFLVVNGVRLAPEYLVPEQHRWDALQKLVLQKICSWGSRVPTSTDVGLLTDFSRAEYAADRGIFDLDTLSLNDYGDGASEEARAMET
jgi:hypothetical protein